MRISKEVNTSEPIEIRWLGSKVPIRESRK